MPIAATVQARPAPHREIRKSLRYQHRVSFPDSLATPRSTFKGRRLSSPKTIQNQSLTRTALNLWSAEVWRQTAEREKFRAPRGSPQCGGFAANARHYWRFERAKNGGRKLSEAGLAEREGFEPSIRFPVYTLSKRAPSATRPPLRRALVRAGEAAGGRGGADYSEGRPPDNPRIAPQTALFCDQAANRTAPVPVAS